MEKDEDEEEEEEEEEEVEKEEEEEEEEEQEEEEEHNVGRGRVLALSKHPASAAVVRLSDSQMSARVSRLVTRVCTSASSYPAASAASRHQGSHASC